MKTPLMVISVIAVLLVSVTLADQAFAQKTGKDDVKNIMSSYQKAIYKAQKDFTDAVKKANADARNAISKGLPTDQINAESKAAISKARADLKAAKDAASKEAKNSLAKLRAAVSP